MKGMKKCAKEDVRNEPQNRIISLCYDITGNRTCCVNTRFVFPDSYILFLEYYNFYFCGNTTS